MWPRWTGERQPWPAPLLGPALAFAAIPGGLGKQQEAVPEVRLHNSCSGFAYRPEAEERDTACHIFDTRTVCPCKVSASCMGSAAGVWRYQRNDVSVL